MHVYAYFENAYLCKFGFAYLNILLHIYTANYARPKYAKNMLLSVQEMYKICKCKDCISQTCKRYTRNMPEISIMLKYAYYMQLYHQLICYKYAVVCTKYAPNMQI